MKVYRKYIRRSVFSIFVWVITAIGFAYITFIVVQSMAVSIFIFVATLFTWSQLFGGNAVRKKIVRRLFSRQNRVYKGACYPWDDESLGWVKGVGYIDSINQPMWIKGTTEGLMLYFFCNARKLPFLVPWSQISHISLKNSETFSREVNAEVRLLESGSRVRFPWCMEFNDFVPATVGLEKN